MTAALTVGPAALGMGFLGFQEGPTCLCPQIGPFLLMLVSWVPSVMPSKVISALYQTLFLEIIYFLFKIVL